MILSEQSVHTASVAWRRFQLSGILLCVLFAVTGCSRSVEKRDRKDWADQRMEKARDLARKGDLDAAVETYRDAINQNPGLAVAHLELAAFLSTTNMADYTAAIYHYRQYLALRPGSEKEDFIRGQIREAEKSFAASLGVVDSRPIGRDTSKLEKDNLTLKRMLKDMEDRLAAAQDATLRVQAQLDAERKKAASQPVVLAKVTPTRIDTKPKPQQDVQTPVVQTYKVLEGDNLSNIALKVYKDPSKWKKIFDANKEAMGGSKLVYPGQTLVIP